MLRIFFMTRSPYRQSTRELECPRVAAKVLRAAMPVWLNAPTTGGIGQRRFRPASFVALVETEPAGPAAYHTRKGGGQSWEPRERRSPSSSRRKWKRPPL